MRDQLQEIFTTLRKNKLRTTLTGLSVSWGIFILIVLLGAGNGLRNGVMSNFEQRAVNRVNLWAGTTSMPHKGLKSGRNIQFSEQEVSVIEDDISESRLVTALSEKTQSISPERPLPVDEAAALDLIERYTRAYERRLEPLAPLINQVARYVPERRKRKLHIGLFGYARSTSGITLPRAIKFTAALYSVGFPPEILGLDGLDDADIGFVREIYVNFDEDLKAAARYLNTETGLVPRDLASRVADLVDIEPDEEHAAVTAEITRALRKNDTGQLSPLVLQAAHCRNFLG